MAFNRFAVLKSKPKGVRAFVFGCRVDVRVVRVDLFDVDDTDDACHTHDFGLRYVEWVIVFVVGHGEQAVLHGALAKALHDESLFACGDEVRFVPLDELRRVDNRACNDVAGIEVRHHRVAKDLNHKVHCEVPELGDNVISQNVVLFDV